MTFSNIADMRDFRWKALDGVTARQARNERSGIWRLATGESGANGQGVAWGEWSLQADFIETTDFTLRLYRVVTITRNFHKVLFFKLLQRRLAIICLCISN